jgi:hypothetical protein
MKDSLLASSQSGATREGESARHGRFVCGDRVKSINGELGTVIGTTAKMARVKWDDSTFPASLYLNRCLAHVEPTASVEAALVGEAKV